MTSTGLPASQDLGGQDVRVTMTGADDVVGHLAGNSDGPLIVVAGGISADRRPNLWWDWAVRPGGPIDLNRMRVLAFDWTARSEEKHAALTTHVQARRLARLLDALGVSKIDAFVGASYGGCVGLTFAEQFPDRIGSLTVISAAHRAHPAATAWRGLQRRLLAFARNCGREAEGVALARQLAMTTYRTAQEFEARFPQTPPALAGDPYPVCDYLIARGEAYAGQMTAERWIALSDSLDRHSVPPEAVRCPVTVIAFEGDQVVPVADSRELARRAPQGRLVVASSPFGHDAFLKEREVVSRLLADALLPLPFANEIAA